MSVEQDRQLDERRVGEIVEFLVEHGASENAHSGGSLLRHLVGTMTQLRLWEASDTLCIAGLIHSVYGTECYRGSIIDP